MSKRPVSNQIRFTDHEIRTLAAILGEAWLDANEHYANGIPYDDIDDPEYLEDLIHDLERLQAKVFATPFYREFWRDHRG